MWRQGCFEGKRATFFIHQHESRGAGLGRIMKLRYYEYMRYKYPDWDETIWLYLLGSNFINRDVPIEITKLKCDICDAVLIVDNKFRPVPGQEVIWYPHLTGTPVLIEDYPSGWYDYFLMFRRRIIV